MQTTLISASIPDNRYLNVNRDGSRSTVAAVAKVALADGITVSLNIYARIGADGTTGFRASLPSAKGGVTFAKPVGDALKDFAESEVADWPLWSKAADEALAFIMAPPTANGGESKLATKAGQSKLAERAPKLVAKPKPETAGQATGQTAS